MFQKILTNEDTNITSTEFEKKTTKNTYWHHFLTNCCDLRTKLFLNVGLFLIFTNILIIKEPKVNRAQSLYSFKSDAVLGIGAN